jgi:hypothetical protein
MQVGHGKGSKTIEDLGKTVTSYSWTDRQPHPNNMDSYERWGNDAEASVALNVLKNIIAGVGFHTEMPETANKPPKLDAPDNPNKKKIDDYCEKVNMDEKLQTITYTMLGKGFCPIERLADYDLKILPPETFYIYHDKKGNFIKYTQERSVGDIITEWQDEKDIVLFKFGEGTYGKSLVEPIGGLLDDRQKMNVDMPKAVHRWAYPIPIMETSRSKTDLQKAAEDRDVDEWIFIGNVNEGEVRWKTLAIDPQARFIPYIELMYYQIAEALHAPLLLYLKNATEASATMMMESVDRLVTGVQRYIKRRVEKYFFEPQVGQPVPRMIWGEPKTGLERLTLADIANLYNAKGTEGRAALSFNQVQHIIKHFINDLPTAEKETPVQTGLGQGGWGKEPELSPKQGPQNPKLEFIVDHLNDIDTALELIRENFREGKLKTSEACRMADDAIRAHMQRAYPETWEMERERKYVQFTRVLLGLKTIE